MRFFTTLFIIALSINTFGQEDKPITKGNFLFGGMFSGSSTYSTSINRRMTQIDISPNVGYFIIDKLALGGFSEITWQKEINYKTFSIGTFSKYYFNNGILLGLSASYGKTSELDELFYSFSPEIGYSYFINSKVALEIVLYYDIMYLQVMG